MQFLTDAARYIFQKHDLTALQRVCVVLPTRRSAFYFKRALADCSEIPFISPEVFSVDDFVMQLSGVRQMDNISLLFELYDVFKDIDPDTDFNRFVGWGNTLLKDFDLIDQYLIENPKALFDYMSDAKAIARWGRELEQIGREVSKTSVTEAYFKLFNNIHTAYQTLRSRLITKGVAYRGMAYRLLADDIETLLLESDAYSHFYFVGLNALSRSEERIIQRLVKAGRAETLWDSDDFYMQSAHKAGSVLRKYKREGNFGPWQWQTDDLLKTEKNIRVIGLETNNLQIKTAGAIYADALRQNPDHQTAIVLGNEQLLEPVLNALDEHVEDFNITMGLSLRQSMLTSLVNTMFELQSNVAEFATREGEIKKIPKFSHRHIHKLLNHPFVRRYELIRYESEPTAQNPVRLALRHIVKHNLVYLSEAEMQELSQDDPIFRVFFTRWNNSPRKAIHSFYALIDLLREVYKATPDAVEIEYLYLFLTILNRIEKITEQHTGLEINNLRHFLNEMIREERIPFSGEPVADLQIMSMLETRCLDFDRVIITSLNEGILPVSNRNNSLIPYDAAIEFGLPVFRNQDAVMSYHFFRLLQRAKNIDLLYVKPTQSGLGGGGEPSRFILQIENELLPKNPLIHFQKMGVGFPASDGAAPPTAIIVPKHPAIQQKLRTYLTQRGVYASHLNDYLDCSLRFYFRKIADLSTREVVDETFGSDVFGSWLHKTLEDIDEDYALQNGEITPQKVEKIITEIPDRLERVYQEDYNGFVMDRGVNYLLKQVAEKLLTDFFTQLLASGRLPLTVVSSEEKLGVEFADVIEGQPITVKISGIIDRIEKSPDGIDVVDYKTGKVVAKELQFTKTTLEEVLLAADYPKLRQLWWYKYIVAKKLLNGPDYRAKLKVSATDRVGAKIYAFRNLKEDLTAQLDFTANETLTDFVRESEVVLHQILTELLNADVPFTQAEDPKTCQYCDFKGICGRD